MANAPYYQPLQDRNFHDPAAQHHQHPHSYGDMRSGEMAAIEAHRDETHGDGMTQAEREAQLAQLLEAVKAGAGPPDPQSNGMYHAVIHDGDLPSVVQPAGFSTLRKRKRDATQVGDGPGRSSKRVSHDTDASNLVDRSSPQARGPQPSVAAARAAGVHSAVALFRSPSSSTAKKATRPPMAKLYSSLHVTPENFLRLQAAAKNYMLDPDHPDRQECVGVRGQTSVDMAKLRLFNCVKGFLEDEIGNTFFPDPPLRSEHDDALVETDEEKWVWPKDAEQIISLVTPLMRRMVTNERQRMYAAETRKGGSAKKPRSESSPVDEEGHIPDGTFDEEQASFDPDLIVAAMKENSRSTIVTPPDSRRRDVNFAQRAQSMAKGGPQPSVRPNSPPPPRCATDVIQFIFMRGQVKLLRFDWPHDPSFDSLHGHMTYNKFNSTVAEHVDRLKGITRLARADDNPSELLRRELQQIDHGNLPDSKDGEAGQDGQSDPPIQRSFAEMDVAVRALTAEGIRLIESDASWTEVKRLVADTPWLEGCLRVVVEVS